MQEFDNPDPEKNKRNIRDHRLSFKVAEQIWSRPILEELDDEHSDDEIRYKAIGLLNSLVCVTVIYTLRSLPRTSGGGDKIRIISAWIATPQEEKDTMNKVKTHRHTPSKLATQRVPESTIEEKTPLTSDQIFALRQAGFSQDQMDALPGVKALTSEQIFLADTLGLFPKEEGELSADELAVMFPESVLKIDEEALWQKAISDPNFPAISANNLGKLVKPNKTLISIRLDDDVIEYFKRPGSGYQSRMNAVLRLWMRAHPNPTA